MLDTAIYGIDFIWKDFVVVKDTMYVLMLMGLIYINIETMKGKNRRTIFLAALIMLNTLALCRILPLISFVKVG